ncbi:hypothetical protein [Acidicapsa acidisoli]|uniref:hypothetical protein n=1 Tax=Acidicapsa acidisoli TaxID=1615681 RepID=UPI0021E045A9|nr:hypothetical protein [Acidicapsa acidisoli]
MVSSGLSMLLTEDYRAVAGGALFLFLSVLMISVFTFVSIAVWTEARRKEREAYYKAESLRRIAEIPGEGGKYVIEMMREEERIRQERERSQRGKSREGFIVGGMVNIGIGVGLGIFLYSLGGHDSPYLVGAIMVFIGLPLLIYGLFMLPKPSDR